MNLNSINIETLEKTLKAWKNYRQPPTDLFELALLGSSNSDLLVEREILLREQLEKIGFETLIRQRSQTNLVHFNNRPISKEDVLNGLKRDFGSGNAELEAWSAVYYLYLVSPEFDLSIGDLADAAIYFRAKDKQGQFRRRVKEGLNRFVAALQQAEFEAHQHPREFPLPDPEYTKLFGVSAIIAQVSSWLKMNQDIGPLFVSIEAPGGWGKTAIARAVTNELLRSNIFAEIVWLSARHEELTDTGKIRQLRDSARSTDDIIMRLEEKFIPRHSVGASRKHKIERLQTILAKKSCLIVIDNLETLGDSEDLLPAIFPLAGKTRFLVTSRMPLEKFAYVQCIRVPELSHLESNNLIQNELNRRGRNIALSSEEMSKIYDVVGGVPLALKLVASQMKKLPLSHILKGLLEVRQHAPEAMYAYTYRRIWEELLDEPARLLLLSLQYISPEGEDKAWIHENSMMVLTDFETALKQLMDCGLVEATGPLEAPLYHVHRLTITFLRSEILLNWQDDYSSSLKKRLDWAIDYVRENRQPTAIQEHIQTWLQILRTCHDSELQTSAATLISLLHPWPLHWGYWVDWEQELNFAIDNLDTLQIPEDKSEFLTNVANLMFSTGRRDDALDLCMQAFSIASLAHAIVPFTKSGVLAVSILLEKTEIQSTESILNSVESILNSVAQEIADQVAQNKNAMKVATAQAHYVSYQARRLFRAGQGDAALDLINNTIDQLQQIPEIDPNTLADSYGIRSGFFWSQDKYSLAIEDINRAIELVSLAGYEFAESAFRGNLGVCYWTIGELKLAEETLQRCIRLAEQYNIYFRLAYDVGNLALVFLSQGRVQDAVVISERHVALAKNHSSVAENMRAIDNYGVIKFHAGDYESAVIALKQNTPIYENKNSKNDIVIQLTNLSRCYAALRETEKAINTAEKAFDYAQQQSYLSPIIIALRCLAEFREPEQSKPLLDQALTLALQCNRPLDEAACLLSLASIEKNIIKQKKLWQKGTQVLNEIGASAWLDGCSLTHPPQIPLMC